MSRGQQLLSIIGDECMRRAEFALKSEGYHAARAGGNFWLGPKGAYYASIACNAALDGKIRVNNGNGTMTDGSKPGRWGLADARTRTYTPTWPNDTDNATKR